MPSRLSHYDASGRARMVDVTAKPVTVRTARAHAFIHINREALSAIRRLENPKGNPLEVARIAGIAAAKKTSELIPLCHPLMLTQIEVECRLRKQGVEIKSAVTTKGETGVEMEALTAASVAALTVYDMCKALDRSMEISAVHLLEKRGGRSEVFLRPSRRKG